MITPQTFFEQAKALCEVGHVFGQRQWVLATGGNLSYRVDDHHFLVTQSGTDKSSLEPSGLMICDLQGGAIDASLRPSAETPMHALLYRRSPGVQSVLHTHSIATTLLSRACTKDLRVEGFEMQKALSGVASHEEVVTIPVFDNDQDMERLAARVDERLSMAGPCAPGFLVRGHGLYAWGASLAEAKRHVEGLEFLTHCLWQEGLAKTNAY
jgi:methylthioribulose-1-phosphate dehydratase